MQSIAALIVAQALVHEPVARRNPSVKPGVVARFRRSVGRALRPASAEERASSWLEPVVPSLGGYPLPR